MKKYILLVLVAVVMGCTKTSVNLKTPGEATLLTPAQNQVCTSGNVLSATTSAILFTWNASERTDSYNITITNLLTTTAITQTVQTAQATVTLLRNTPYSWYITSKSSKTTVTTKSAVSKFYNSGPGVQSYAPFPAEIISPTFNQAVTAVNGKIGISWQGSSVSNNIAGYSVYFGTSNNPPLIANQITNMFVNGIAVTSGTTYYWHVGTVDANGNYTDSGLFQFTVN